MTIVPVNMAAITNATVNVLLDAPQLGGQGVTVVRGEQPSDSELGPKGWVGVYGNQVVYTPRTVGMGAGFMRYEATVHLLVRMAHYGSGAECNDLLEALIQEVLGTLLTAPNLGGTVEVLNLGRVVYADYDKDGSSGKFTQTALVTLTGEGSVAAID